MKNICGVSFKNNGKIYFFNASNIEVKVGDSVIVETERGKQLGIVQVVDVKLLDDIDELKEIVNVASASDIEKNLKNIDDAMEAIVKAKELSKKLGLSMSFTDSSYNLDRTQLVFSFVSDSRVDFRELAKELAGLYKTRIELRQIGVRDKAKEVSGLGQCGRELCCAGFLKDLDSVSINMAKNQNLALNPTKINGQCGRLLCCLKYEDECYKECNKKLPKVGKKISTKLGTGKVISVDPLKMIYKVDLGDQGIMEFNSNEDN